MRQFSSKICIVGAGPAGASTSLFLSKFKLPHILVDGANFPRDKVCGESFDGRVTHILNALSTDYLKELQARNLIQKTWNYSINSSNFQIPIAFPEEHTPRLLAHRRDFDHFLIEQVKKSEYVKLIEGEQLRQISYHGPHIILSNDRLSIQSELAVMAVGSASKIVQKSLTKPYVFFRAYFQNLPPKPHREYEFHHIHLSSSMLLLSIGPISEAIANIEIGMPMTSYQKLNKKPQEIWKDILRQEESLAARFSVATQVDTFKGRHISFHSNKIRTTAKQILYAGSSAFSVNPITGMGVGNAMSMGRMAAEHIQQCFQDADFSQKTALAYKQAVRKKVRNVRLLNAVVNLFLTYPRISLPMASFVVNSSFGNYLLHSSNLLKQILNPRFYSKFLFKKST